METVPEPSEATASTSATIGELIRKNEDQPIPQQEIFVIPREMFNYGMVAVAFLVIGVAIGFFLAAANGEENRRLIEQAVAAAVASGAGSGTAGLDATQIVNVSADDDPFIGPVDAPVTIIEFGDFTCGYCRRFHDETLQAILTNYEGQVRFVFRDMPILNIDPANPISINAALAAECADDQGRFWAYHDLLYANQQSLSDPATFSSIAVEAGVDINTFSSCLNNQTHLGEVVADRSETELLGLRGTPAFFINGRYVSGAQAYQVFASIIDQELANAANTNSAAS